MPIDHSATYKDRSLKNFLARSRLRAILSIIEANIEFADKTYADVGCSNGFLTDLLSARFKPSISCGYDHNQDNLAVARSTYQNLKFDLIDLNAKPSTAPVTYDVVTCFEVLEHVGNIPNALGTLLNMTAPAGGVLFLTVPIEIGWRGTIKFLIKTLLYRYKLDELPQQENLFQQYLGSLLMNRRMDRFRDRRSGWSSHFGFDYREVDDLLTERSLPFESFNEGMTRFYLVRC
jgi:2-polyprenyl-3-methyl-5-hydroxy-6-metoxy-1,4-benzoquinol methylase